MSRSPLYARGRGAARHLGAVTLVPLLLACGERGGRSHSPKIDTSTAPAVSAGESAVRPRRPSGQASARNTRIAVGDSTADASAAATPQAEAAPLDSLHPDSVIALGVPAAVDTSTPAAAAPAANGAAPPGAAPAPSVDDLALLRRELTMPLAGIDPASVPDSFDDPRGAHGERRHEAFDILAPRGTPVLSAAGGRLVKLLTSENGGLMVYASDSSERFILMYAHLDRYAEGLKEGMVLLEGQVIGYVGTTGNAPPNVPHLHFAIARVADVRSWWRGTPVNPRPLLLPTGN